MTHLGDVLIAAGAVAQASRTANCPLEPALDTTWSLRDSTNPWKGANPSDFSFKVSTRTECRFRSVVSAAVRVLGKRHFCSSSGG